MPARPDRPSSPAPVAFLFLGETLLVPHLQPIAAALAELCPDLAIDCWAGDAAVEEMLLARAQPGLRIRRAPGFKADAAPRPAAKLIRLARLAPALMRAKAVVCAEQTSLWLPRVLPVRTRFIKTSHGVGSMSARDDPRRRAAWRLLVPSELERETYLARGFSAEKVLATGYVKASFVRSAPVSPFPDGTPTILYAPHWQRHRSSWWAWGRDIVALLTRQNRFNVILAPHQRLAEGDPAVAAVLREAAQHPHVHVDLDSPALVDGSYTALADIYLGDTSSQVVEFLAHPRPCVFLNNDAIDWRARDDHGFWQCGEVVDRLDAVWAALERAEAEHPRFRDIQARFAADSLGDTGPEAPYRIARIICDALKR